MTGKMRLQQHPEGYLLESAPCGLDYFWRPTQAPIGTGATGFVAKCWQLVEDRLRPWAVKVSHYDGYNTAKRVAEEAKKLRAFHGLPGVLQSKGIAYTQDSHSYIVMRLENPATLADVIYDRKITGALYNSEWMRLLASQLCQAVAGMHRRKVAWLDGKPKNVLCCEHPDTGHLQITLCDFDASMWIRRGPLLRVSKIAVRGTEDFSSPELLTGIKMYEDCDSLEDLDGETRDVVAADAWSVGAILFNAATGNFLIPDGPDFRQAGSDPSDSDAEDDLRPAFVMSRHQEWKEHGMEEVWDRLCRATSNDVPLLAFLQQLLSLDPAPRAHFAALAQHPYLHLDQPPQGDSPLPAAAAAAASDAVVPAAVMPDEAVWKASLSLSGLCMPEEVECMVPIPGIPFLVYNPIKKPLCATSSGGVHRAWYKTPDQGWQQCPLKRATVHCIGDEQQPAACGHGCSTEGSQETCKDDHQNTCTAEHKDNSSTEANAVVSKQVEGINASVDALLALKGALGVPEFQCVFDGGVHFTHFRLFAPSMILTMKDWMQWNTARPDMFPMDFRAVALKLLQILQGLHAQHHYLGVLLPERIATVPQGLHLLELAAGDWSDDTSSMQRICPYQLQRHFHQNKTRLEACSAASNMYTAGVLLAELVIGRLPFPGEEPALSPPSDRDVCSEYKSTLIASISQQMADPDLRSRLEKEVMSREGPALAQLVMALLHPDRFKRPSATRAMRLPLFTEEPQEDVQTDQQETTSLTQAGTAKPSQDQQEPALIPPVTFTNPRPTASATPPSNQTPTPTLTTTPTGVSEDHGAPSREGSVCLGGAIDVAARAGPGSCSPAAPASGGTNAVDTHVETSVSASSRKVSRVCLESSEPDACKPQVAEAVVKQQKGERTGWGVGAASAKAAHIGSGVAGWVKDRAQAHPKATMALAAVGCLAVGFMARRRR